MKSAGRLYNNQFTFFKHVIIESGEHILQIIIEFDYGLAFEMKLERWMKWTPSIVWM